MATKPTAEDFAAHIAACHERYKLLESKIDQHTVRLERLESMLLRGGASIIGLLILVVAEIFVGVIIAQL